MPGGISGMRKQIRRDMLDSLRRRRPMHTLRLMSVCPGEQVNVRLRIPVPYHLARIELGASTYSVAGGIVIQELNSRGCNGIRIFKGDKTTATVVEKFGSWA
jgi:hypothetical protein